METRVIRVALHTGPTIVREMANKCREAGLNVTCEGTETIYVSIEAEAHWHAKMLISDALAAKHGTAFGLVQS